MSTASFTIKANDATKAAFDSVNKRLHGMTGTITGLGAKLTALVGAGGFGALIGMSMKATDALGDQAQMLGINTQKLAGLNYAAELNGSSQEAMSKALGESVKRLGEAATGSGDAGKMIKQLGLNVNELKTLSPDQLFTVYADKISQLGTKAEQTAAISKLMGDESKSMLNVIEGGAPALAAAAQEAEKLGYALNATDTAKVQAAMDSFTRVQTVLKGVGNTIAVQLAPYLEALANWFADAAVKHGGFKDAIISGVKNIVEAVAFMGDIWRGLEVVWKGLEVIFWGFVSAVLTGIDELDKAVIGLVNLIPGVEIAQPALHKEISDLADQSRQKVIEATDVLGELANKPMPSANVKAFFAEIEAGAQKAAEKTAQVSSAGRGGGTISLKNEQDEKAAEAQRKKDEQELERVRQQQERINAAHYEAFERLRETRISENEQLRAHYDEQALIVEEAFQNGWASEQERKILLEQLELEHQAKLGDITAQGILERRRFEEMNARQKTEFILSDLVSMTQGVAQSNRAMFEINKAAAIAQAIMEGYAGAAKTWNAYPYPLNIPMTALHVAGSVARISAIQSSSFSDGGAPAPSLAGTGAGSVVATVPADQSASTQTEAATRNITLNVGDAVVMDKNGVRALIDMINEEIGDGVKLAVA